MNKKASFCHPDYADTLTLHYCALFAMKSTFLDGRRQADIVILIPAQLQLGLSWSLA